MVNLIRPTTGKFIFDGKVPELEGIIWHAILQDIQIFDVNAQTKKPFCGNTVMHRIECI